MTVISPYKSAYPFAGTVAVLCEGDLIGYEASMLGKWRDSQLKGGNLVDIWACGTCNSLYGFSDAIGRAIPVLIIEDRDYRTLAETAKDCKVKKEERERRNVQVIDWRSWRLNEIENYLMEPRVLEPVMTEAFACDPGDVQQALSDAVAALIVHQSAQYALYQARKAWEMTDTAYPLSSNISSKPNWDDERSVFISASVNTVKEKLENNCEGWRHKAEDSTENTDPVGAFIQQYDRWRTVDINSNVWREDWSGKDLLRYLRMALSARYGWREDGAESRTRVAWSGMDSRKRFHKDWEIERALKGDLEARFLEHMNGTGGDAISKEWQEIADMLRNWRLPSSRVTQT